MENTWNNFWSSGSVSDYLIYRNACQMNRQSKNLDEKVSEEEVLQERASAQFRYDRE